MKKWFAVTAIFLTSYMLFLIATLPLAFVVNMVDVPKKIEVHRVTGTIWQGHIEQVSAEKIDINNVHTDLSFWSLLMFSPTIDISFGDAMTAGPEGKLSLTATLGTLELNDVEVFISANDIAKKLPLPVPVSAQGNAALVLEQIKFNTEEKLTCEFAQGDVHWNRAGVVALDNTIKLTKVSAKIACNKGDITAALSPKNNIGLNVDARFNLQRQKLSGQGYLKPGAKFPAQLKPALSFLGRADNQGRYAIKF